MKVLNVNSPLFSVPMQSITAASWAIRNSAFYYKDKPIKIAKVGQELDVRYVLEGSVLKSGEQIRISAQLIDALKDHHVWSETYIRQWTGLLPILDEITLAVVGALLGEIGASYDIDLAGQGTGSLEAWLLCKNGEYHF